MSTLKKIDPQVYDAILKETLRQHEKLELIASENFVGEEILEAQGSTLTNKYAEGYPGSRWYHGCEYVDVIENLAIERAKKLFGAEHANVQPHSGSTANMAAYFAMLKPGDTVLALDLACGGHLTHGHPHNFSGKFYNVIPYGVSHANEQLDFDEIRSLAIKHRPKLILAGASAYPRTMDFKKFRQVCDEVGAFLLVDMAHIAGLVAAGLHPNPVEYSEVVTSTTHKTLRGPRAGLILCRKEFAKKIDSEIFPGIQGGPLMHVIAAKAVCFKIAQTEKFKQYQKQVIKNATCLCECLKKRGFRIVAGGTDTHLLLVDLGNKNITGQEAAETLDRAGITVNKNLIPFDRKPARVTSGIRLGSPAITSRGMKEKEIERICDYIDIVLSDIRNESKIQNVKKQVSRLVKKFPIYKSVVTKIKRDC